MASLISKASLLMVPSVYEDGTLYNVLPSGNKAPDETGNHNGYDQTRADFTFSRGSNLAATRVNASGLIEKGRENLITESNNFSDSDWTKNVIGSVASGHEGYDGTNNAWLITKSSAVAYVNLQQLVSSTGVQTFSVYAKAGTLNRFGILAGGGTDPYVDVDLSSGTITGSRSSVIGKKIEDVGNGWYRVSMVFNETTTGVYIYPDWNLTNTGNLYIQDAQLEKGLVSTPYIATGATTATAGVLENTPRIDYSSGAGALLLEPQRTNLITQSEYIGATEWVNAGATKDITITKTSETNPEGGAICWKIESLASSNQLAYFHNVTNGTTYTNSIYVKRVSGTGDVKIRDVNNVHQDYSLSVADGWKRIHKTGTANSTNGRFYINLEDVGDEILVWGAQQEAGSYVSSYVPTYGSAATRGADRPQILNTTTDVLSQTAFTLFFEADLTSDTTNNFRDIVAFRGASKELRFETRTDNSVRVQSNMITSGDSFNSAMIGDTDNKKFAMTFTTSQVRLYADGSLVSTYNGVYSSDLVHILFMNSTSLGVETKTNFKQYILFNEALTDAECITLTTL